MTKPIPVNLPEGLNVGSLDEFRRENGGIFDVRVKVQTALRAAGAIVTGAGCGFGEADIDFDLNGEKFNLVLKRRS